MSNQLRSGRSRTAARARRPSRTGPGKKSQRPGLPLSVLMVLAAVAIAALVIVLRRPQPPVAGETTAAEAYQRYQAGAFFLDVRTQAEYDQGHIAGSVLIPIDQLQKRLNEVPRDQAVVLVVCRAGAQNSDATAILRQAGYSHVTCISGGMKAWASAGYPVAK